MEQTAMGAVPYDLMDQAKVPAIGVERSVDQ